MSKLFDSIPEGTDLIQVRKKINKMLSDSRKRAKPDKCILCGKPQTSFCNSHSVPQMSLKAIAENGIVLHASAAIGISDVIDIENGVNKSGTFNFICNSCDGTFFQDYENPKNLVNKQTDKMLGEIAVKNFLLQLSKRRQEKELIDIQQKEFNVFDNVDDYQEIKDLDYKEYEDELFFHKKIVDNNESGGYQILYDEILPYKVPVAMQSAVALISDMNGNRINDVYDMNPNVKMQYAHICVLPLEDCSVILMFYHKRDKLYRNLRHQINSCSKEKTLEFINYVIFAYTENYYISKKIETEILSNQKLQELSREYNGLPGLGMLGPDNLFGLGYKPIEANEIPNFLDVKWAV